MPDQMHVGQVQFLRKTVCPPLSVGWLALHCASEGASLFGVLKSSAFEPSASPALRIFRGVLLLSGIGALALPLMGIQDAVGRNLGIADHAIVKTIAEYGNSSTATIPLSLMLTNQAEPFRPGEKLLLAAAGAEPSGGALLVRKERIR